ncbi:MAG: HIRAN domain-containing protein [Thaumarchaeota archaeon]|nr:HIRAN domain-containing protein [Nitrososphaerota archaeon]
MFRKRKSSETETDSLVEMVSLRLIPDNGYFTGEAGEEFEVRGFNIMSFDGEDICPSDYEMVLDGLFYCRLAGITHNKDANNLVGDAGQEVLFVREPDNPVDKNAIKVLHEGKTVGYVPATLTREMTPHLISVKNKGGGVTTGAQGGVVKTFHKKGKVVGARVIMVAKGYGVTATENPG